MIDEEEHPELWEKLLEEDRKRNTGMPIEIISAKAYAERLDITLEEYIIMVLRSERDRVQAIDRISSEAFLMDQVIDGARTAGMTIVEYIISGEFLPSAGPTTTWKISPDFFARILTRYQERYGQKDD